MVREGCRNYKAVPGLNTPLRWIGGKKQCVMKCTYRVNQEMDGEESGIITLFNIMREESRMVEGEVKKGGKVGGVIVMMIRMMIMMIGTVLDGMGE